MIPIANFDGYLVNESGQVANAKRGNHLTPHLNENGYLYVTLRKDNKNRTVAVHRLVAETFIPNPDNKPFVNHIDADRTNPSKSNLEWCTQSENIKHAYKIGSMSQKKNFTEDELAWLLNSLVKENKTMTALAKSMGVGLSRLTINMRNHAHRTNQVSIFEQVLREQKVTRNTQANAPKQKPVCQYDLNGNHLACFPSVTAACRALGKVSSGTVINALNPNFKQTTAYGYLWKYV